MRRFSCASLSDGSMETARSRVLRASSMRPASKERPSQVVDEHLIVRVKLQCPFACCNCFLVTLFMTGTTSHSLVQISDGGEQFDGTAKQCQPIPVGTD